MLKSKTQDEEFELINEKLDYLLDKLDSTDKILEGLINISLGDPPSSAPEAPINEDKANAACNCNADISDSNAETLISKNEAEYPNYIDISGVSGNSIKFCLYKYTYIWETSGRSYWAFLLNVNRRSVSGFRWSGRNWVYFGIDLRRIDSFECYR